MIPFHHTPLEAWGLRKLFSFNKPDVLAYIRGETVDFQLFAFVHFVAGSLETVGAFTFGFCNHPYPASIAFFGHDDVLIEYT